MNNQKIFQTVKDALVFHGWNIRQNESTIAGITFWTGVGPKDASFHLRATADTITLSGQYFSEGRDILAANAIHLDRLCCDEEALLEAVDKFNAETTRAIQQSYAGRLVENVEIKPDNQPKDWGTW